MWRWTTCRSLRLFLPASSPKLKANCTCGRAGVHTRGATPEAASLAGFALSAANAAPPGASCAPAHRPAAHQSATSLPTQRLAVRDRPSLGYHFPMIADTTRNGCFDRAIIAALQRAPHAADHVLDIGSGSGLLALMAVSFRRPVPRLPLRKTTSTPTAGRGSESSHAVNALTVAREGGEQVAAMQQRHSRRPPATFRRVLVPGVSALSTWCQTWPLRRATSSLPTATSSPSRCAPVRSSPPPSSRARAEQ